MTKQCRIVLNNLRKISNSSDIVLGFLGDTTFICLSDNYDIVYDYQKFATEIKSIIEYLVKTNYLYFPDEKNHNFFSLTHKGLHPYRVSLESVKIFLIRSFITPIIVSIIVSAITTYVTLSLSNILG